MKRENSKGPKGSYILEEPKLEASRIFWFIML